MPGTQMIRLSANENCYGCSPLALEAGLNKFKNICFYPDVNPMALKEKIAEKYGVPVNNIVTGAGSVRVIDGLIQTFVGPDDEVITFEGSFAAYKQLSAFHNRKCRIAGLSELRCEPEQLYPLINDRTRLIFISNPNNPTGTIVTHDELEQLLRSIPPTITVVVDEAYAEYATDPLFPNSIALQREYSNLVILRSFSKIYGLAALRIGYGIMDESKAVKMSLIQIPFSINYMAATAAIAALDDDDFKDRSVKDNAEQRTFLHNEFVKLGYRTIPSQANFIYLCLDSECAKAHLKNLLFRNGILICDLENFGLHQALRITVGNPEINKKIISLLKAEKKPEPARFAH